MRFTPYMRDSKRSRLQAEVTPRKLAYAARAIRKDQEDCPLFPELADQRTPEQRVADNDANGLRWVQRMRDKEAANWRRARALLRGLRPIQRAGLLRWWQSAIVPGAASYLLSAIHDATAKRDCHWHRLAQIRRFKLIGEGRLPNPWIKKPAAVMVAQPQKKAA